jgi:hypothetical protein
MKLGTLMQGEQAIRLRYRRVEDGLPEALQLQVLEAEHLPTTGTASVVLSPLISPATRTLKSALNRIGPH